MYSLAGRIPELYLCALGTLKHRAIFCPLFSAFGPEPIAERLQLGEARVLFTTERLYKRRIAAIRDRIPTLEHVIVLSDPKSSRSSEGTVDWADAMAEASAEYEIADTDPETPALLHFTSGTTGTPKGAYHVHQAVLTHYVTGKLALDLHPGDIYWCTADPGWVTGTSYGISAPLSNRVTMIIDEAEFDPTRWYRILEEEKVQVWYTAPTAIRMLMKAGPELPRSRDLSALRFMASVGEPLNPQAVIWGQEVLGKPFHDNWWQTETGGIMISNYASMDVRPGSMGRPMPGVTAGILREGDDGHMHEVNDPELDGELALRPDWPSVFRGYWNNQERYDACFRDGLVPFGGPRASRRRRILLVRRPRRRRDQVRGAPDRPVRGRKRDDEASGGRRSWRHRQTRSGRRHDHQSLRQLAAGALLERRASQGAHRLWAQEPRNGGAS